MAVRYTDHAREQMRERGLREEWVERVLDSPDWTQPDPKPGRMRAFGAISGARGKILRVVYKLSDGEPMVLTAFFDRDA